MIKRISTLLLAFSLAACSLASLPLCGYAVDVKTNDGQISPSVEEETGETAAPLRADQIEEGSYDITVRSSSSMFRVTACELSVAEGKMTANMTLSGTSYLRLYMGTDSEAASAPESDCISYTENPDGTYSYTVPVEALNKELDCAAFSGRSNQWFPRTLVFESSSLPEEAILTATSPENMEQEKDSDSDQIAEDAALTKKDTYEKASSVKASRIHYAPVALADGNYSIKVDMTGGSGKASISSPAEMTVKNGRATARIQWSSPNYDYMVIDDLLYEPVNEDGNSVFEIPVTRFDGGMKVIADTTAMSQPYEIEYILDFNSEETERLGISTKTKGILMLLIILAVILAGFINGRLRSGKVKYDAENEEAELAKQASAKPVSKKKKKLR